MAYYDVSLLSNDNDFRNRCTACYSAERPSDNGPTGWVADHAWQLASTPSFGDKYAYAIATGVPAPGRDESVISDGDILAAVQAILNAPE